MLSVSKHQSFSIIPTPQVPKKFWTCDYEGDRHCGDWYTGEKYWIAITGGAGLLVGIIRYVTKYPRNLPGLFKDIHDFHVHPNWAPVTFLISTVSLCGGATLGPEQALVSAIMYMYLRHIATMALNVADTATSLFTALLCSSFPLSCAFCLAG
jgi:hypothetical protein